MNRLLILLSLVFSCVPTPSNTPRQLGSEDAQTEVTDATEVDGNTIVDAGTADAVDSGTVFDSDSGTVDSETADSGTADSGTLDSGTADSGTADSGTDSGTLDSGTADSGTLDSGTLDSGTPDSGTADSGTADSGTADSGTADYVATHFVESYAESAYIQTNASSDYDLMEEMGDGGAAAYSACQNASTPCTLRVAVENCSAGDKIQMAPGQYIATQTVEAELGANFRAWYHVQCTGAEENPVVFFAQYPAAYNRGNPSLWTEFYREFGGPLPDYNPEPFFGITTDYIILDGIYADSDDTTPAEEEGILLVGGAATGGEVRRVFIAMDDVDYDTGENKSAIFMNNHYGGRVTDSYFDGNGSNDQHNSAAIQTRWCDSCIIEHNTFDGVTGIWMKGANWGPFLDYDDASARNLWFTNGITRVLEGDTVVDGATGATATALFDGMKDHQSPDYGSGAYGYLVLTSISGSFGAGSNLQVGGVTVATTTDGALGIGFYHRSRNCTIRFNRVTNAPVYACRVQDQESISVYQNIFHGDNGLVSKSPNANDWNQYPQTFKFYNNTLISNHGWSMNHDGGLAAFYGINIADDSEFHSNIIVDDGALGVMGIKSYPDTMQGRMGAWRIHDRNVWYATTGSEYWNLDFDHASVPSFASLTDWKAYADDYGTQPGQLGVLYEANSVDTDPQFVSADYSNAASGDWRLADNGQDARTIGLSVVNGGVCGPYITGIEEIGTRANTSY